MSHEKGGYDYERRGGLQVATLQQLLKAK